MNFYFFVRKIATTTQIYNYNVYVLKNDFLSKQELNLQIVTSSQVTCLSYLYNVLIMLQSFNK